ncbi:hypothetical protein B0H15DRAFT_841454 [Mycena belliarum]|uniref:F-box domain-containing protein n=1 Tax=Mycena belliarum TaxID=1033014 RepID=A0AAD6U8F8_9AGAR|nr:hypothetical protein B0H15DRAFT_841454 [Mycena belliae]
MAPAILLSELPPDVIFSIFAHCDISSVVSASQTCKYLHGLAFQKSVWLMLLDCLRQRGILDCGALGLTDLTSDTTAELVHRAKRLVTGPDTWAPRDSRLAPEVAREIILHPKIVTGVGIFEWWNEARLLPSGRYVLFKNLDTLECWDVARDRLVWTHASSAEGSEVTAFAAEETGVGNSLLIFMCERAMGDRKNFVEIVELHTRHGTHRILLFAGVHDTPGDEPFSNPVVCGALAVVALDTGEKDTTLLVFDWKAQSAFALDYPREPPPLFALVPGHLLLTATSSAGDQELHLIAHAALPTPPLSADGRPTRLPWAAIPILSTLRDQAAWTWEVFHRMAVHASPVRAGEYRVWLCGAYQREDTHSYGAVHSYRLVLPGAAGAPPAWHARRPHAAQGLTSQLALSYAGHALGPGDFILRIDAPAARGGFDVGGAGDFLHLSAYSGAVTYSTSRVIVIQYFK